MKRILLTATALTLLAASAQAATTNPNADWYLGLSGDATWAPGSDTGGGANLAVGYRFVPSNFGGFRLEGKAGFHGVDDNRPNSTHYSEYMANAYYDFYGFSPSTSGWRIVPYVGAGIGDVNARFHDRRSYGHALWKEFGHFDNDAFAYNFMGGLSFIPAETPHTEFNIGYRYLGTDRINSAHIDANNVEVGISYHF